MSATPRNRGAAALTVSLLLAVVGCNKGPGGGGGGQGDANLLLTEAMFQRGEIIEIAIEMDPADWDALRFQTRSILDVLGSSCLDPPQRPFTYFPADVIVNGEKVTNVGIRKKGFFGSLDEVKPSLKIKFGEYELDQRLSGLSRMTLNNNKSDKSHIKQCLGYEIFANAGIPAPRCNFARVAVNGQGLGIFTHVESIKKQFLRRHFADNSGDLWEGALSDFRPGWVGTFQRKTNKLDPDALALDPMTTQLNLDTSQLDALVPVMERPDDELLGALAPFLDVDTFMDFWILELLIGHPDGYARNTNNFYLYIDPDTGLMNFIPWGIDSIFSAGQFPLPWETDPPPLHVWDEGILAKRLYRHPTTQPQYFQRMQDLLDAVWDETALMTRIDEYEALLSPFVVEVNRPEFDFTLTSVRDFVAGRRAAIETALAQAPPVSADPLRDPWCIDILGTIDATFSTTWGTIEIDDIFSTGTGTLTVDSAVDPTIPAPGRVGSKSGYDEKDRQNVIQIAGFYGTDTVVVAHLTIKDPADLVPGRVLDVDWRASAGYLVKIVFDGAGGTDFTILGMIGDGVLTLDEAGTNDGDVISGSLSAVVYEPIF